MVNENLKPVETVYELKNEYKIPSFEEFMKTYESDGNVNYDDLNSSDIGTQKGYGPTTTQRAQTVVAYHFSLRIECHNWNGFGGIRQANSAFEAFNYAHMLENNNWPDASWISNEVMQKCATLIYGAIRHGCNNKVDGYVKVKGKFWGGCEWSYNY